MSENIRTLNIMTGFAQAFSKIDREMSVLRIMTFILVARAEMAARPTIQKVLRRELACSQPAAQRAIAFWVDAGVFKTTRDPDDTRSKFIRLTDKGKELLDDMSILIERSDT